MKILFTIIFLLVLSTGTIAQVYSNLEKEKNDSTEYQYILPILGEKAHASGFDLPYSAGIGANYIWQKSDIVISNVNIGFNNGEMYDIDELVRFNTVGSESMGINVRPDIWLFPFLNVYGIMARAHSTTNVDVGVWIPRLDTSEEIFSIQTNPEFQTTTFGFGITPTAGFLGGWLALDMNMTWTDVDALDKSVFTFIFDPRIGKTFNLKKKESNLSFWVGGFRLKVNRDTKGNLAFNEIFNTDEIYSKIDIGYQKVGEAQTELDNWWDGLTPIEQKNPANIAKRATNQTKLNVAGQVLASAENAANTADNSTIQYKLDKKQKSMWNFMVGTQYQLNKHFMVRGEYGFLTSRQHVLIGLQYRFGL
ncbi:MAG: hypothetical protein ABFS32_09160 [Bacteroidota bacterium]